MHYGTVNDALEAIVSLSILRDDGAHETFEFIVDTGLSEEMVLPDRIIDELGLLPDDPIVLTTADGRPRLVGTYTARILWHDRPRDVHLAGMGDEFLIGMELLRGSNLNVDAVVGGAVVISELGL